MRFLETMARAREKYNFLVYCYCLMDNHVHLLINDNGNDISRLMKSINVSYVSYFNRVYNRFGHLFQDRFKSEIVTDDSYLLEVSRYIHNNPVKVGMVQKPEDYQWSSYKAYIGKAGNHKGLIDTDKILAIFSNLKKTAINEYQQFTERYEEKSQLILDIEEEQQEIGQENHNYMNGRAEARQWLERTVVEENLSMDDLLQDKEKRDKLIKAIRKNSSLSLKELGELFGGLSESRISRIVNN